MDKLSLKVLKHIATKPDNVSIKSVVSEFGDSARKSLAALESEGFIKSGRTVLGVGPDMKPVLTSNGQFSITSKGLAFLEDRPGILYNKWSTRFFAIWGAITGTAALVLEVVLHFL